MSQIQLTPIALIDRNPNNPRKTFPEEAVERMARSIQKKGILVPLRIMPGRAGRFFIVSGETRLTAAERAGLADVPCLVVEDLDEQGVLEDQIIDNGLRNALLPTEEAAAIQRLKMLTGETSKAIAERLDRNPSEITTFEALLTLPEEMRQAIDRGQVPLTSGYHLATLTDPAARWEIFGAILDGRLNRDATIRACRKAAGKGERKPRPDKAIILRGESASLRIDPGTSPEELYTLAGKVFRAAEAAKKAGDITLFGARLS